MTGSLSLDLDRLVGFFKLLELSLGCPRDLTRLLKPDLGLAIASERDRQFQNLDL